MAQVPPRILPIIIFSQFAGTSLWFAGNAVLNDLQLQLSLPTESIGYITTSVQIGFILGTLTFAFFAIADRFPPNKIFFICSALGALSNSMIFFFADGLLSLVLLRFMTGFFLAGIYPVGMQLAASWYKKGLGEAMGYLVGALVVGTAFPHLLKSIGSSLPWESIMLSVSILSGIGGLSVLFFIPVGPYHKKGGAFHPLSFIRIFRSKPLRLAALGYFGHMWELYAFWAFVPVFIHTYTALQPTTYLDIPLWTFIIIGAGSLGCIFGGVISKAKGSARVAFAQLLISGTCCLISPILLKMPISVFLIILVIWGVAVVGDSPQFSTLVARYAPPQLVGTSLTMVNSIGFFITIFSIQSISYLISSGHQDFAFIFLLPGPVLGLIYTYPLLKESAFA